ncbi:hypothetical protein COB64_04550 [Candidatus Wolfebacteria bacterium]|nr:MAG: hypothetical protein COB64_04550 [Candidatus Wolfebacteria bacterium]
MIENVITSLASNLVADALRKQLKGLMTIQPRRPGMNDMAWMKKREIGRTIEQLYLYQEYAIDNPTMNKILTDPFYEVSIELIKRLEIKDEYLDYYKNNFGAREATNKFELIGYLLREQESPRRNDVRYLMGFRSIYCILIDNLATIDVNYIDHINEKLEPFYRYKINWSE